MALLGALAMAAATVATAPAASAQETAPTAFVAVSDTYVDANSPTKAYGGSTAMTVDNSPVRHGLLRFDLGSLAGKQLATATLRLYSTDSSPEGGRVFRTTSPWDERTTWNTRPTFETTPLRAFGSVSSGRWYDLALPVDQLSTGVVSLGIDTTSANGARWSTREATNKPVLLVTTTQAAAPEPEPEPQQPTDGTIDGLSAVAGTGSGSSDSTYFTSNARLAVTQKGRVLALHGKHREGVQLTWRDPSGSWQTSSTGASTTGGVLTGTGTGDWPASLAVAKVGELEHAWVVWSGPGSTSLRPVQMRRLSDLDSPQGPTIGPIVTIDAPALGAYRADIAFETGADGVVRGCVLYSRQVGDYAYELTTVWLSSLATDTPSFVDRTVHDTWTNRHQYGSLVPSPAGMRVIARTGSKTPQLFMYQHARAAARTAWTKAVPGPSLPYGASPTGVALPSGEIAVAFQDDFTNHVSQVFRFSADGSSGSTLLRQADLVQPSIVGYGSGLTLVGVRQTDGAIVSRSWSATTGWSAQALEVNPVDTAGRLAWPNVLRQADGRLRVLAQGPGTTTSTSSVWAYQRQL